jgi:hypothetical protein
LNDIDIKKNTLNNSQINFSKNIEFKYSEVLNRGKKNSSNNLYSKHLFMENGMLEWMKTIETKPNYDKVQRTLPIVNTKCRFLQEDLTILFANIIGGRNYGTF